MMATGNYIELLLNVSLVAVEDTLLIDSLDLGPLYEPESIEFTFETPGWYILGVMLSLLIVLVFIKWLRQYLKNRYRREALKSLLIIETEFYKQKDILCMNDVLVLLKLVAIKAFGRQTVAELYGDKYLLFLEEKGNDTPFLKYTDTISGIVYNSNKIEKMEFEGIIGLTKKWIKTHA
jgi:hypothetical protein